MEIQKVEGPYRHCPKCCLHLNPWELRDPYPVHCPRCAYDLTIIDVTEDLIDPQDLKKKQGKKEICDLLQMMRNWSGAYQRLVGEKGVDWSLPHCLLEEVGELMLPYIARLKQTGYIDSDAVKMIGAYFDYEVAQLIVSLEQTEQIMYLTGEWTDNEQEIKDHWQERFCKAYGCTFGYYLQMSMRDDKRIADDSSRMSDT